MGILVPWIASWTAFYVFSTTIALLRLYLRAKHGRFGKSDALATLSLALSTIMYALAIHAGRLSLGKINLHLVPLILRLANFYILTAAILVPMSKLCVLLLLLEVEVAEKWKKRLKVIAGLILVTCLVNVTLTFFSCSYAPHSMYMTLIRGPVPIAANPRKQKYCFVRDRLVIGNGALNVIWEGALFVCAMSLVYRVRSGAWQKVGLALSFGLGLFTIAATIMNTYWTMLILLHVGYPPLHAHLNNGLWIAAEAYTGLTVSSVLPIRAQILSAIHRIILPFKKEQVWSEESFARSARTNDQEAKGCKIDETEIEAYAVQIRQIETDP